MKELIRDNRGNVPNYVLVGGVLRHQPSMVEVPCSDQSDEGLRRAKAELDGILQRRGLK